MNRPEDLKVNQTFVVMLERHDWNVWRHHPAELAPLPFR
jgi:hypothetical protein